MKIAKFLIVCSLLLLTSSCARRYSIATNTYADTAIIPEGFPLASRFAITSNEDENPMLTKEVANKIAKILQESGYQVTGSGQADYLLSFSYDMRSDTQTVNVPTFIPGPVETTCSHIRIGEESMTYHEERSSPDLLVFTPELVTLFTQALHIEVFKNSPSCSCGNRELIWQGASHCSDSSCDLRDGINYLLVSSFRYFGQNTNKHLLLTLDEKNPTVRWLQGEPMRH